MKAYIQLDSSDNVVTAIKDLEAGFRVETAAGSGVELSGPIQNGHKLALNDIRRGEHVRKYGKVIGEATADIKAGEHVHVHNVMSLRGKATQD